MYCQCAVCTDRRGVLTLLYSPVPWSLHVSEEEEEENDEEEERGSL